MQVHYTAAPIFEEGVADPIPERSGFVQGEKDEVDLVIDPAIFDAGINSSEKEAQKPAQYDDLERACALNEVNAETIEELRLALVAMKPERTDDYKLWIDVLEALASLKETPFRDDAYTLAHEFSQRCPEKYDSEKLNKTWEKLEPTKITHLSIFKWAQDDGWVNPRSAEAKDSGRSHIERKDHTDAGNVALLAKITDGNLRYIPERHFWLLWDGEKWITDGYGTHAQDFALKVSEYYHGKVLELLRQTQDDALDTTERNRIKKAAESLEKWTKQCRNKRSIDAMLGMAKADNRFTLSVNELDQDPWLLGVGNGVVDLRTGTLRETSRDEYVTRRSPVCFDPTAKASRWIRFITEITALPDTKNPQSYKARPNLANYLQLALGYSITGSTREHKMFICIGDGSNGKNILLDILQFIMSDYCQTIPPESLMANKYGSDAERPSPTMAMLAGARTAISSESKEGHRLDVAMIKRHTGGGFMTARFMRENTLRFEITHKLWLMTNHKPALDHMDDAMRGRLHLIPFDRQWNRPGNPERNPLLPDGDKNLMEVLKSEAEGILAWLVEGAVKYAKNGLEPPEEIIQMTQSYFKENDILGLWLDTYCEECDPRIGLKASELFENYRTWCVKEGYENVMLHTQKTFSNELKKRGIHSRKLKDGNHYGLRERVILNDDG